MHGAPIHSLTLILTNDNKKISQWLFRVGRHPLWCWGCRIWSREWALPPWTIGSAESAGNQFGCCIRSSGYCRQWSCANSLLRLSLNSVAQFHFFHRILFVLEHCIFKNWRYKISNVSMQWNMILLKYLHRIEQNHTDKFCKFEFALWSKCLHYGKFIRWDSDMGRYSEFYFIFILISLFNFVTRKDIRTLEIKILNFSKF